MFIYHFECSSIHFAWQWNDMKMINYSIYKCVAWDVKQSMWWQKQNPVQIWDCVCVSVCVWATCFWWTLNKRYPFCDPRPPPNVSNATKTTTKGIYTSININKAPVEFMYFIYTYRSIFVCSGNEFGQVSISSSISSCCSCFRCCCCFCCCCINKNTMLFLSGIEFSGCRNPS